MPAHEGGPLGLLARRVGVQRRYVDGTGVRRAASDDAVMAVFRAMGVGVSRPEDADTELRRLDAEDAQRLCEPVSVAWAGSPPTVRLGPGASRAASLEVTLIRENESARSWRADRDELVRLPGGGVGLDLPADLPVGFHRLQIAAGGQAGESLIMKAPPRCHDATVPTGVVGAFMPLHAARSDSNLGIGDCADLERLARWAGSCGCRYFGTLPVLTTLLDDPFEPSPYVPASRSVFGEIFIDVHGAARENNLPGLGRLLDDPSFGGAAARLRSLGLVDYAKSWGLVRRCLEAATADVERSEVLRAEVERFARSTPLIRDYARFRGTLAAGRGREREDERLFLVAQWLLGPQLRRAAGAFGEGGGLYLDLPIGSHPGGFDAWRNPGLYASGAVLGAPPDGLFRRGQSWGFPPVIPAASRRAGHREFSQAVGRHLEHASALRIDHAAGLFRCFWVPEGFTPENGVYVRQPAEELLAVLSIHSHRRRATVVAENLGTVPRRISSGLERRGLLNMEILQFGLGVDQDPTARPHARGLVALNTHDMPTFAAFWTGQDVPLHARLGVIREADAGALRAERASMRQRVTRSLREAGLLHAEDPGPEEIAAALLELAAGRTLGVLLVGLEDLWGETEPQNIPGIAEGYPNWRRKARRTLDEIERETGLTRVLAHLAALVGTDRS
jgi:4-alpha-glucanotransferase